MSAAIVNLVLIMSLGRVYEKLALKLTQWGKSWESLSLRPQRGIVRNTIIPLHNG